MKVKFCLFFFLLILSRGVFSQDRFDQVKVLEDRKYDLNHRVNIDLGLGFLPLDAYYKPLMVEGALGFQFNEHFTWEVVRGGYSLVNFNAGLAPELDRRFGVKIENPSPAMQTMRYFVGSEIYWNLLYSKSNFLNKTIVYHQWQLGGGPLFYDMKRAKQISFEVAAKVRFFVNNHFSFYFRAGHSFGMKSTAGTNIMNIGTGAGFAF